MRVYVLLARLKALPCTRRDMNIHLEHLRQKCHFASQPEADADGLATELAQIYDAWYKCRQEITRLDLVTSASCPLCSPLPHPMRLGPTDRDRVQSGRSTTVAMRVRMRLLVVPYPHVLHSTSLTEETGCNMPSVTAVAA